MLKIRSFPRIALLAVLLAPAPAFAWGVEGHEIVAAIALRELAPTARSEVGRLLGSPVLMIHEANWADEIRDARPRTGSWHYVDIPLAAGGYDMRRDCPDGDCVVAQIDRAAGLLSDRRLAGGMRAEALRFLIHFVADVHQPLHAEDNDDKGGNQVHVRIGRMRANLHKVWDTDVVAPLGYDSGAAADEIVRGVTAAQKQEWRAGPSARWANESHAIAREHVYPPLAGARDVRLPRDYAVRQAPLARLLLAKAGVRLGWILNRALAGGRRADQSDAKIMLRTTG